MNPLASFDPPDSHWAADFDARLTSTFHWLKDRIDADEKSFAETLGQINALKGELEQLVKDARHWAEAAKDAAK